MSEKCPGHGCDHVLCIEQRRVLDALTAERQAREQAEQERDALAAGWDAATVKRQVADFNAMCEAARHHQERARQAEQERDRLRAALRSVVVDCEDGNCTLCERCVMTRSESL